MAARTGGVAVEHDTLGLIIENETTLNLRVIDSERSDTVCTYAPKKSRFVEQEFFRCPQCFRGEGLGVCGPCSRRCHRGHRGMVSMGVTGAYCDCGLKACSIACAIGAKCTFDEVGTKTTKWYECWTCWGENRTLASVKNVPKTATRDTNSSRAGSQISPATVARTSTRGTSARSTLEAASGSGSSSSTTVPPVSTTPPPRGCATSAPNTVTMDTD